MGQECEKFSRKYGRSDRSSAVSGAIVRGVQQEEGKEYEVVNRKICRNMRGSAESGKEV